MWAALRAMVRRGHKVRIICDRSLTAPYTVDGIRVVRPPRRGTNTWLETFVKDSDLLVTHLDLTSQAMQLAMAVKIPLVHFVHNDAQLMYWRVDARVPYKNALAVYNSHWLAKKRSRWNEQEMPEEWLAPSVTVHPVVERQYYECERGTKITLVNPTPGKGVETFKALAERMPEYEFLAVEGGYGEQIIVQQGHKTKPGQFEAGGNIEWMAHTPDIREVFRKTKVLLMPSEYESYGRVGVEAACCGIPTIANPTLGLLEAFGDAGIFLDRTDIDGWEKELRRLLTDDVYYHKRSQAVLGLADSLTPEEEFDRLEQALIETANRYRGKDGNGMAIWICDGWIWRTQDGNYKRVTDQRIPSDAVSLAYGRGAEVPEDFARKQGWIGPDVKTEETEESKAIEAPDENKAIEAPTANKAKKRRTKKVA